MARTVTVTPQRWLPRGEAEVVVPGRIPLVVWGGIPGEASRVRLGHQGANQAHGEWASSDQPDPHRVEPICEKYRPCGGCPLMHLDADGQDLARRALVRKALDDAGLDDVPLAPSTPSPDGLTGFRYVVKVGFGVSPMTGRARIGAWARHTREIVPIPDCHVAAPILRKTMVSLAHHTLQLGIQPYENGRGVLRSAVLRASRTTGEVLVTLVAARRDKALQDLAEELGRGVSAVVGVWLHLNDGPGNAIFARDDQGVVGTLPLAGREWIEERLNDLVYRVGPGDFFQTNPSVAEVLYARTVERLALTEGEALVDLYCGVGGITLLAARQTGFALGVEEIEGAVTRAREAARMNRVPAEFTTGKVVDVLQQIAPRFQGTGPCVVVDPSRRGLEPGVIEAIGGLQPRAIAYVSCNPTAMGRDLAQLRAAGYALDEVDVFDMFPNTSHVECLTIARPEGGAVAQRRAPRRKLAR
ncbi:MAG: 23S rRNA (uracil(1939)-C(5))-methyltransferase RlmD [Myxococcota bacterium]